MPTYSSNGYPAAVTMRSNRTLLVEGPDDKATVTRLYFELRNSQQILSDNLHIDTAADIPEAAGGNRERVEAMHTRVGGSDKFAAMVDREFRHFDVLGVRDLRPSHCEIPVNLFWTRGHSIENYLSDVDIFTTSLEESFPEHLPSNYKQHLQDAFPSILQNCAGVSLAAYSIGKLDRIQKISELDHWIVKADGSLEIDLPRMHSILTTRGISESEQFAFDAEFKRCLVSLSGSDLSLSRWICHGHIAECHIWCAVAAMLRHHGMTRNIAPRVAWGEREALVRVSRGAWAKQCALREGDYPIAFVQWLCS